MIKDSISGLTLTEQILIAQLKQEFNITNTPIFRNGNLVHISGVQDNSIYENRQLAYSSNIFISDEYLYNLNNIESVASIKIPHFEDNDGLPNVTSDISYILKMRACCEKDPAKASVLIPKVFELMKASPINWLQRDYSRLAEQLYKVGLSSQGKCLDDEIDELFKEKSYETHPKFLGLDTDLVEASSHDATCAECSALQGRVYSISGNDNRFPKLPDYAKSHGNFHDGCRHTFYPFYYPFSSMYVVSK